MAELLTPFIIIALILVIVIQAVERYFYHEQTQREISKLIAAVMSKNMNEYTQAVRVEKEEKAPDFTQSDEVDLSNAEDETFDKFIGEQTK